MPSPGDNLSLGGLGFACGVNGDATSLTKLAVDCADDESEVQMSDFYISAVAGMTVPDTTPGESTSATATVTFSDAGSLFNTRIRTVNQNFTWAEGTNGSNFTLTIASDYTAPISYGAVSSNTAITFQVAYRDYFNTEATNYNTPIIENATIQNDGGAPKK